MADPLACAAIAPAHHKRIGVEAMVAERQTDANCV